MKRPQVRLRTLLLLTAGLAVLFAVCAQWPVKMFTPQTVNSPKGTVTIAILIERPPTVQEWLIRIAVSGTAIAVAIPVAVIFYRGVRASLPARRTSETND